jgi:glycosyltransferase involved in cell wall biosynthesis
VFSRIQAGAAGAASMMDTGEPPSVLLLLAARLQQMGGHSGYHLLAEALPAQWPGPTYAIYRRYRTPFPRLTHKLIHPFLGQMRGSPYYNYLSLLLEFAASRRMRRGGIALAHVMFAENDYGFLAKHRRRGRACVVASVHSPSQWWRTHHAEPSMLAALDGIVAMSPEQLPFLEEYCRGPIEFHRLGVDVEFFRPAGGPIRGAPPRFISCGVHLRDFKTLADVIELALTRMPDAQFDLVVPEPIRHSGDLRHVARRAGVHWHSGLTDEELRTLYQRAVAMVLPLRDGAANNAVGEATACGLPILSTDLTGIRAYTTPAFADLFPRGAADAYVAAMLQLAENPATARQRGLAARQYALATLGWPRLAAQMVTFYRRVIAQRS